MLYRKIQERLNQYYKDKTEKILLINGARQIGKSFIIRETASKFFKNYIELNLKEDKESNQLFINVKTTEEFYFQVSALYGDKLGTIDDTIIFLDEIQEYPHLITLLKPLRSENRYRLIASGSLLGLTLRHIFIPMGSIEEVKMYPLDFEEFLIANNVGKDVLNYLEDCFKNRKTVNDGIHKIILNRFKEYLICGGLPDSVNEFVLNKNVLKTRINQNQTYTYYMDDSAKYDNEHNLKIRRIYEYLQSFMENKVKRIQFKKIEDLPRANLVKYQDEFDYLVNSGCAIEVKAITNPEFPLNNSISKNLIKLYYNDVGILSNLLFKNNINAILNSEHEINLGSIYETVCATELKAHGHELYYFDSKKVGEVDFLVNDYDNLSILPIEIKSGNDVHNFRALPKLVKEPYNLKRGYVFSNKNIVKEEKNIIMYPIYMIMFV